MARSSCSNGRRSRLSAIGRGSTNLGEARSDQAGVGAGEEERGAGQPTAGDQESSECVTPAGVDLNALFGVTDQIITRFCPEAAAGDRWRLFGFWIVNGANDAFPPGYVPSGATPIEDFVGKLVGVRVVVDGGTRQERTVVLTPSEVLRTDVTADGLEPGIPPFPMAVTLPRMKPLSAGQHTRELIWELSAQHCDGFGTSLEENCLPAGDVSFGIAAFTSVTPEP